MPDPLNELRTEIAIWLPTHIAEIPTYKAFQVAEVLMPLIRRALADAWDEGYGAGDEDARAVQATYPYHTQNPYRGQRAVLAEMANDARQDGTYGGME